MKSLICSLSLIFINLFAQIDSTIINQKDALKDSINISSTIHLIKADTLIPLFNKPLNDNSSFISQEKIKNSNYRYFGDLISLSPVSSIREYGFIGYPNTLSLYGNSYNVVSILKDGLQINERLANYFNLNMLQTEEIDSIEIIPLPRGALYSSFVYPTTVNVITKDFLPTEPFSRIRYYQGPDREAFINGYFNAQILKKLFFSFSVTNRIKDETYQNNDFSIWQGNFKLKYLLSNRLNFIFSYDIIDYKLGYNGGVDYDSILKISSKPEDLLYDPIAAPVLFPEGEIKLNTHFPRLTIKSKLFDWLKSDFSFFYLFNKSEKRDQLYFYLEDKVFGANVENRLTFNALEFGLLLNYEKINDYKNWEIIWDIFLPPYILRENIKQNLLSLGSYASLSPFSKKFSISLFYKYSILKEERNIKSFLDNGQILGDFNSNSNLKNSSIGIDLNSKIGDNIFVYAGYSIIGKYLSQINLEYFQFESSIKYKDNLIETTFKYFINEYNNQIYYANPRFPTFYNFLSFGNISGISSDLSFNYKDILIESTNNYFWKSKSEQLYNLPQYSSRIGLFYYDKLFNDNLDLKAGVVINLIGNQLTLPEFQSSSLIVNTNPVQTIDLSISGTIQKSATLFFVWENLLNKKYFLVPYYPMPQRNIRFGVSWEFLN